MLKEPEENGFSEAKHLSCKNDILLEKLTVFGVISQFMYTGSTKNSQLNNNNNNNNKILGTLW